MHRRRPSIGTINEACRGACRGHDLGTGLRPALAAKRTPQGGVISPLLANLYMNRFLRYWRLTGRTAALSAHVVAYADDFVILSRGHAAEALAWTEGGDGKGRAHPQRGKDLGAGCPG